MRTSLFFTATLFLLGFPPATAQIAVSAHDGKQVREGDPVAGPFPDEIVTLAFGREGPEILGRVSAPATLNGPPVSVAVAPSGRFALVAVSQRLDDAGKLQPRGAVSLIDIGDPRHPRLVQTLETAPGAMGVTLNPNASLALVTSANDDSIALLAVDRGQALRQIGSIKLDAKAGPRDVIFAPGGKRAYAVRFGDGKITELAVSSSGLSRVRDITVGTQPYGAIIGKDGRYLYNANFGGTPLSGTAGAISTVDLRSGQMVAAVAVGTVPEHVVLSPDGRLLAAVMGNGSAFTRTAANFATVTGRLRLFRVSGPTLTQIAEADIGHNCQGAAFSDDGRALLVQCAVEKDVSLFRIEGETLVRGNAPLTFDARPGAIATARSR
ncbi:beta-propeller fold lactonase family protein [Sphingomonas sp.]|uniref:lactonase family protein n=1 Tax=Sphingomonas sp. TaxID=28214 RepID=UPI0025F022BC|nr:beta-propeller fold lactonase family protein [Sphingomonas sp.]